MGRTKTLRFDLTPQQTRALLLTVQQALNTPSDHATPTLTKDLQAIASKAKRVLTRCDGPDVGEDDGGP